MTAFPGSLFKGTKTGGVSSLKIAGSGRGLYVALGFPDAEGDAAGGALGEDDGVATDEALSKNPAIEVETTAGGLATGLSGV
jgi:hypothetical protein